MVEMALGEWKIVTNKEGVSLGGFTKWNKICFKVLDIFRTASPFSKVQSNTPKTCLFHFVLLPSDTLFCYAYVYS